MCLLLSWFLSKLPSTSWTHLVHLSNPNEWLAAYCHCILHLLVEFSIMFCPSFFMSRVASLFQFFYQIHINILCWWWPHLCKVYGLKDN
jgi:hypothetical protein